MSATKIIHVLKNDSFEDVFDLFKNADAEEIIFIFPKGSRFAKQSQYFEAIKSEADTSDKKVSVMTNDSAVLKFAAQAGLSLLEQPERNTKKVQTVSAPKKIAVNLEPPEELRRVVYTSEVAQTELKKELESLPNQFIEKIDEPIYGEHVEPILETAVFHEPAENITPDNEDSAEVMLAAAKAIRERPENYGKPIRDIFTVEPERSVKIKEEKSRPVQIDIRNPIEDEKFDDITKVWAQTENRKSKDFSFGPKIKTKTNFFKKTALLILGGIIIIATIILYGSFGNAKITIKPKKADLNFTLKVSASITATSVDNDLIRIPGQRFSNKEEVSDTFSVTGQKNVVQKASGKIIILNKSTAAQRLVATTRFKTSNGLIFRIPQTINVPAATKIGSTMQEGSIESIVYADRPGAEYNISPSTFTIPGFDGTPKANDFYAKSDKPMTGGIVGPSKIITEEDYLKAQEILTAKLKDKILKAVKNQSGELKVLDSLPIKYSTPMTNAKAGDGAENLQMTIEGIANVIAFREADVGSLVKNYVEKNGDLELLQKDLTISYSNPQLNADSSVLAFDVQVIGQTAAKLDINKLLKDISGMSENTIRDYFGSMKEINSAHIRLAPFWVKNIPKDPQKIKINIDQN